MSNAGRDYNRLVCELSAEYTRRSPFRQPLANRAQRVMVDGGSHGLRLIKPFPAADRRARGHGSRTRTATTSSTSGRGTSPTSWATTRRLSPQALPDSSRAGHGLQTGFTDRLQIEVAEILCQQTGAERVRFTTSGALATMYATMLARAFTGRDLVLKVGGGWHGAQPWALKGVYFAEGAAEHWRVESQGLPGSAAGRGRRHPLQRPADAA